MKFVLIVLAAALLASPALAADREISIPGGAAPLYGSILTPDAPRAGPAVLLIAGSGPTDRDGNSTVQGIMPGNIKQIAQTLAAAGIPSLRFDKRGIAKSAPATVKEEDLTFGLAVDDAVAFGQLLAREPGVTCVVIVGHSEGALIGALVAQKMPVCGLIEIAGPGRALGAVLRAQLGPQLPQALMTQVDAAIGELEAGRTIANIPGLESLFRPSVQPYLISQLSIDPAKALAAVKAPVLIMQGETDIQVTVEDARLLAAARPDATLLLFPGVNHVLRIAPLDRAANVATYADPALPLAPGIGEAIIGFVKAAKAP